jgi:hypothetical protein
VSPDEITSLSLGDALRDLDLSGLRDNEAARARRAGRYEEWKEEMYQMALQVSLRHGIDPMVYMQKRKRRPRTSV